MGLFPQMSVHSCFKYQIFLIHSINVRSLDVVYYLTGFPSYPSAKSRYNNKYQTNNKQPHTAHVHCTINQIFNYIFLGVLSWLLVCDELQYLKGGGGGLLGSSRIGCGIPIIDPQIGHGDHHHHQRQLFSSTSSSSAKTTLVNNKNGNIFHWQQQNHQWISTTPPSSIDLEWEHEGSSLLYKHTLNSKFVYSLQPLDFAFSICYNNSAVKISKV